MMSSLAASHAKNNHNSSNNDDNESFSPSSVFGPITDKSETQTLHSSPSPQQPTISVPTRIPYPLPALLTNKTNQFRRSASLHLRDTKSNFLFLNNTFRSGSGGGNVEGGRKMATEHTVNTFSEAQSETTTKTIPTAKQEQWSHITHNELSASGRVSPRRKLVLNPQNNFGSDFRRSLSLRKNYKYSGFKTDTPQQEACKGEAAAAAALPTAQLPDSGAGRDVLDNHANGVSSKSTNAILARIEAEIGMVNEIEKMSLNPHGSGAARPATLTTSSSNAAGNTATSFKPAGTPKTPRTPTTGDATLQQHSHIHSLGGRHSYTQAPRHSPLASVPETKLSPKTPPVTPDSPSTYLDDDLDSMYSFATTTSGRSTMSCEHPYVARNGTTFSGRKMKYVVHCSNYAGQGSDYLTPTQRAARQIRRLKEVLCVARQDLEQKDSEILRLTREVVELRLFKASLSSPEERSASSDAVTVREAELKTSQDVSPIVDMIDDATKTSPRHVAASQHLHYQHRRIDSPQSVMQLSSEMQNSFADSGHFEDMTSSSVHSKDSYGAVHTQDMACGSDEVVSGSDEVSNMESYELQRQELIRIYEQRIEELIRNQDTASSELKRSHNDKVEALLQKLAECNTRYADIVPDYEHAKERIRELEKQLEDLQRKLAEHEDKQNKMYLHMYQKGQEAEKIARADQALELAHRAPNSKVSINELLHQLQNTQDELENIRTIYRRLLEAQKNRTHVDPEVTLQFLKSAIYYFLTDKENSQGHLQAIESILEFTETEKQNISKAHAPK